MSKFRTSDNKRFLTNAAIEQILSPSAIQFCIRNAKIESTKKDECLEVVLAGGKKVMAVLVLMKRVELLVRFVERDGLPEVGNLDSKLPFKFDDLIEIMDGKQAIAMEFESMQWEVTLPFFRRERTCRLFRGETIIPFITKDCLGEGAFGDVYNVSIPGGQHGFGNQFGSPVRVTSSFKNPKFNII